MDAPRLVSLTALVASLLFVVVTITQANSSTQVQSEAALECTAAGSDTASECGPAPRASLVSFTFE